MLPSTMLCHSNVDTLATNLDAPLTKGAVMKQRSISFAPAVHQLKHDVDVSNAQTLHQAAHLV